MKYWCDECQGWRETKTVKVGVRLGLLALGKSCIECSHYICVHTSEKNKLNNTLDYFKKIPKYEGKFKGLEEGK